MDDSKVNIHEKYRWLPKGVPESQLKIVLMLAKGHSHSYTAQQLDITIVALRRRLQRFQIANPEYYDNLRGIIDANTRLREELRHIDNLDNLHMDKISRIRRKW